MEFFYYADAPADEQGLRDLLTLDRLPEISGAIDDMGEEEQLGRVIYFCHWGRYHLRRGEILGGVRFYVPDCPNALAWTVTTGFPPAPDKVVIHGTINRTEHDEEFIACTRELLDTLRQGIEAAYKGTAPPSPTPTGTLIGDLR